MTRPEAIYERKNRGFKGLARESLNRERHGREMNRIEAGKKKRGMRIAAILTAAALCAGMWGQAGIVGHATNSLGSQNGQAEEAPAESTEGGQDSEADAIVDENTESLAGTSSAAKVRVVPSSARLRAEASTDSDQVGSLSSGDEIAVVGETTGSDGNTWYQVSGDINGETVTGYIRSDLVEVTETVQAEPATETPAEPATETPAETESTSTDEYSVSYADDGTGVSDWYLNDNVNGTRYKITDLLNAQQTNESNIAVMEEQTGSMRMIIIILAVIIGLLVVVVTILIFKLRSSYEDDGFDDDEDYDEDEDEDDEDEDEDDEEEYIPRRRRGAVRRPVRGRQPVRGRRRYEEDDDEYGEDEDDRYDDEEEEEPPRRSSRQSGRSGSQKNYKPRNFVDVDDDDDLDFEFLDLK